MIDLCFVMKNKPLREQLTNIYRITLGKNGSYACLKREGDKVDHGDQNTRLGRSYDDCLGIEPFACAELRSFKPLPW